MGANCYNFGSVSACGSLNFKAPAPESGKYTLRCFYLDSCVDIEKHFDYGEDLSFPVEKLNESYKFNAVVISPQDNFLSVKYGEIVYNKFSFRTSIGCPFDNFSGSGSIIPSDPPGTTVPSDRDLNFRHIQFTASKNWVVVHNLGKYPSVTTVTSNNQQVFGEVEYIDIDTVQINFSTQIAGQAYLN